MDRKKCLQLSLSVLLPAIGLVLDLYCPDVLNALCLAKGMTVREQRPYRNESPSSSDREISIGNFLQLQSSRPIYSDYPLKSQYWEYA
jgi:hypothetical protein